MAGPRKANPHRKPAQGKPASAGVIVLKLLWWLVSWAVFLFFLPALAWVVVVLWLAVTGTSAIARVAFTPPKGGD